MAAKVLQLTRSRCRGCLLGALLGDCLGGDFEARESVSAPELLRFVLALQPLPSPPRQGPAAEPGEESGGKSEGSRVPKILYYSDDTAMAHSLVRSLLAKKAFDEVDMAKRFAEEYDKDPDRSYGGGVVTVFKKLLSPKCRDVFEPARQQFNGRGSYGNGGAMRVAGISLAYSDVQDVKKMFRYPNLITLSVRKQPSSEYQGLFHLTLSYKYSPLLVYYDDHGWSVYISGKLNAFVAGFAKLSAELTHANSLGYNGAILQALAVHYALCGESNRDKFLDQLIGQMEDVEADDKSVADARMLGYEDRPFSKRLKKIREFLEQGTVSRSDVLLELGNGIEALNSVPTAIYSFLRCMESHPDVPDRYNSLQRTIMYCILLGGDTDTIATMAGAIAGAFYGEEQVPQSWRESCEAYEETEKLADGLYELYHQPA